jgi:hypothetical protein
MPWKDADLRLDATFQILQAGKHGVSGTDVRTDATSFGREHIAVE